MEIENRHLLCIVAWQQPDYLQCYRVDGILALRHLSPELARQMTGHPGNDLRLLPDGDKYAFAFRVRSAILQKIERWTTKGLFVAVYTIIHRDKAGYQRAYEYNLSWRRAEKYLTAEDLAWLSAYSESSFWYTDRLLAEAIGRVMAGIGQVAGQIVPQDRPKKKKKSNTKIRQNLQRLEK